MYFINSFIKRMDREFGRLISSIWQFIFIMGSVLFLIMAPLNWYQNWGDSFGGTLAKIFTVLLLLAWLGAMFHRKLRKKFALSKDTAITYTENREEMILRKGKSYARNYWVHFLFDPDGAVIENEYKNIVKVSLSKESMKFYTEDNDVYDEIFFTELGSIGHNYTLYIQPKDGGKDYRLRLPAWIGEGQRKEIKKWLREEVGFVDKPKSKRKSAQENE